MANGKWKNILEYVWLDGYEVKNLRSKIKVVDAECRLGPGFTPDIESFPEWGYDGSSTGQATGDFSDVILKPVKCMHNPFFKSDSNEIANSFIVLCDIMNPDGSVHESSTRSGLVDLDKKYAEHDMWFAFEQEYTIYDATGTSPYNWPVSGFPEGQGRYYCGIGGDVAWGRDISDEHLMMCLEHNLCIVGTNAEVMPSQWEFQSGPLTALDAADNLWLSRFLLNKIAEKHHATISLDPKPIKGDWNGAGCHTNFSTKAMREKCGKEEWTEICEAIGERTSEHMAVYGNLNHERLTGDHETCSMEDFRFGESDRGAAIRIPPVTSANSKGYLEDRRPAANIDPYLVCKVLLETVCESESRVKV